MGTGSVTGWFFWEFSACRRCQSPFSTDRLQFELFCKQQVMPQTGDSPVRTECNTDRLDFQPLQKRQILGVFDGGAITSDAGGLLLREVELKTRIIERFMRLLLR